MGSTVAPDLLARRARLDPEAPALAEAHAPERWTSFADWDARVQRTAHALAALGVGRGRRVALLAANHPTWLDVWLACGRLGAALVPLNLRLPAAPLRALVERSRPTLLIHDARHAERAAEVGGPPRLGLDALEARRIGKPESADGLRNRRGEISASSVWPVGRFRAGGWRPLLSTPSRSVPGRPSASGARMVADLRRGDGGGGQLGARIRAEGRHSTADLR